MNLRLKLWTRATAQYCKSHMHYLCPSKFLAHSIFFRSVSCRNESVLGIVDSIIYVANAINNDPTANESGLLQAYQDCVLPNETCDITYLRSIIYDIQHAIGCYLALANGPYQPTADLSALLNVLSTLNETAINASNTGDCNTL